MAVLCTLVYQRFVHLSTRASAFKFDPQKLEDGRQASLLLILPPLQCTRRFSNVHSSSNLKIDCQASMNAAVHLQHGHDDLERRYEEKLYQMRQEHLQAINERTKYELALQQKFEKVSRDLSSSGGSYLQRKLICRLVSRHKMQTRNGCINSSKHSKHIREKYTTGSIAYAL